MKYALQKCISALEEGNLFTEFCLPRVWSNVNESGSM